ncbi:MAG: putative DNA binding domain-containing protein [Bacteroidales bacterium]|nr:putative DNA binding domain-containing protein [Bacteroidales bacterium]
MHFFRDQDKIKEFLNNLLMESESEDVEFKHASGGFPGSFWDTYSAFANTEGGTIILGVIEKNDGFYLDPLPDELVDKYKKDFWNNVNNKSTVSCNLLKNEDLQVVKFNDYNIILFHIPCARREQRPIFRTTNPYNGTFKRNNEGDYKCTEKEVQRMYADANDSTPADSRILTNYSLNDIDKESLQQYRQVFAAARPSHPWIGLDDMTLLEKLGGYRKDRETGKEGFTVAGLLMFGKYESITDIACTPDFFPDYQEWIDDDSNSRWSTRIYPDGTWEANLFQFYRRVLPRLQNFLPNPFRLDGNTRIEETSAHVAIREAFINLCVHADFTVNANLLVKHIKNKFVFSNPGTMLITKAQYYKGGQSVCRNKSLQKMFMMLGAAEKAGSGVDKILKGWNDANWRAPYIDTTCRPDTVNLYLPMISLLNAEVKNGLICILGNDIVHIEHNRLLTLALAYTEEYITNERLRYALNMHKTDIYLLLKDLCNKKYLKAEGHGRGTKYCLPFDNVGSNMGSNVGSMGSNVGSMGSNVGSMGSNIGSMGSNVGSITKKRRMKKEELYMEIVNICSDWVSLDFIAATINRNSGYLLDNIIPSMLKEELIERMYPQVPRHPKQKYKAKNK